jgi:DNA-directed RNA polymerase specialized sigma24 family protein
MSWVRTGFLSSLNPILVVTTDPPRDLPPSQGNGWLGEQEAVEKILSSIAARLRPDPRYWDWEDLMQEGRLRIWQMQQEHPGQAVRWYLHNAELYLRNLLRSGRSLDSAKRRSGRAELPLEVADIDGALSAAAAHKGDWSSMYRIYADDWVEELRCRLDRREAAVFELSLVGYGTREIARELQLSVGTIANSRQAIASAARRLGLHRASESPSIP